MRSKEEISKLSERLKIEVDKGNPKYSFDEWYEKYGLMNDVIRYDGGVAHVTSYGLKAISKRAYNRGVLDGVRKMDKQSP